MPRIPVPEDFEGGVVTVAGTEDFSRGRADVNTDAVERARDLSVREDEDGRYVGCSSHYADDVRAFLGVTETDDAESETLHADGDGEPDSVTCEAVKTDGEVCGRELPCPYHSDDEEGF